MREHAAAVDVGDNHHRAVHRLGKTHVGDVVVAQVDLRGRARALDHDGVVALAQTPKRLEHRMPRDRFVTVIRARVEIGRDLALNDDLRAGIGVWLQQHRVHVAHGVEPAGLRLHRLGAADFAAVGGHGAVERHILRFERRHAHAASA